MNHMSLFSQLRERSTNFLLIFFLFWLVLCKNIYMTRSSPEFIFFWEKFVICSLLRATLARAEVRTTLPLERSALLEEENECALGPDFTFSVQTLEMRTGYPNRVLSGVVSTDLVELEGIGAIDISLGKCGKWKKQRASSTLGEAER